jgi:hypothetical protein
MTENVKTLLIVGGVAIVGFIVYKKFTAPAVTASPIAKSTAGTGNSVAAATKGGATGDADFWQNIGAAGKGLNDAVSSVESGYNSIYNLFGGGQSSTNTGQGNNMI